MPYDAIASKQPCLDNPGLTFHYICELTACCPFTPRVGLFTPGIDTRMKVLVAFRVPSRHKPVLGFPFLLELFSCFQTSWFKNTRYKVQKVKKLNIGGQGLGFRERPGLGAGSVRFIYHLINIIC